MLPSRTRSKGHLLAVYRSAKGRRNWQSYNTRHDIAHFCFTLRLQFLGSVTSPRRLLKLWHHARHDGGEALSSMRVLYATVCIIKCNIGCRSTRPDPAPEECLLCKPCGSVEAPENSLVSFGGATQILPLCGVYNKKGERGASTS
jgi:hypothetical protein